VVLAPVALSGVLLVALAPGFWWIFTTYFWVAFPAFGLLARGGLGLFRTTGGGCRSALYRGERAARSAAAGGRDLADPGGDGDFALRNAG